MPDTCPHLPIRETGQSLIEVLAAMALLLLLAAMMMAVYSPVSAWLQISWQETAGSNYAVAIAECLRYQRDLLDGANSGYSAEELGLPCSSPGSDWESQITISNPPPGDPPVYQVGITVNWDDYGTGRSVHIDTLIRQE